MAVPSNLFYSRFVLIPKGCLSYSACFRE